jgi:asparagine synthase (glutamine-hydrolysing)
MCGIAGIIRSRQSGSNGEIHSSIQQRLQLMADALQHRGPDGEGYWINSAGNAGLCHRRLAIIDLSKAAAQPMHYMERYSIVHNGEIYNYIELKKELQQQGFQFRTQSDTEVILAAYHYWKDECVDHFDGMFAFAIWDEQEQQLFAARDRFGEKPFFYHHHNGQFVFASEMKALWATAIPKKANLKMLFNYVTIGYTDNPERPEETFFETVFKLPAASILFYTPATQNLTIETYWDIDTDIADKQISESAAIEKFQELFFNSIKRRLRGDVAIGTSLSGGLDSSSITAITSQLLVDIKRHHCFTASFPGFIKDESAYARQVAKQFNLQQHQVAVTADNLVKDWSAFIYQQEEPVGSSSAFAQYKVFELARQNNVTVLLDGQGADEILAGYHKYYKWYWQELFIERKLLHSSEIKKAREKGINEEFTFKNIIAALFPDLASVVLERQYLLHALRQQDLTRDFIKLQSKEAYYTTPAIQTLNGQLYFNTCVHGLEELLRYADRNSMAHGREVRLPFLDHQLVEFIFSLPASFKIKDGWSKWLLRQSMSTQLPDSITWRKDKTGFEPPQHQWMQHKDLQEMIMVAKKQLATEKIITPQAAAKLPVANAAYDKDNFDWRYLSAAACLL